MDPHTSLPPSDLPAESPTGSLDDYLGLWLGLVATHVSARLDRALAGRGFSATDWLAVRALFHQPESTHQNLIHALGMTKGAVSKLVTRLEQRGLMQRCNPDGDQRVQNLSLTAAGDAMVHELTGIADDNEDFFFTCLTEEERTRLLQTLRQLVHRHRLLAFPTL